MIDTKMLLETCNIKTDIIKCVHKYVSNMDAAMKLLPVQ